METYSVARVCYWADGTSCDFDELPEYLTFMSDDYEIVDYLYDLEGNFLKKQSVPRSNTLDI